MSLFRTVNPNPSCTGRIRQQPQDFQVDEIPSFEPFGEGEHVWLQIRKTGENTDWVASLLAKIAGVPRRDVSYAGMKDRNAITTQWFSIQLPGRDAPDWQANLPDSIEILATNRHLKKLRRGALQGNHFKLIIRDFSGDTESVDAAIQRIIKDGVPNYFGAQRFGHNARNIETAESWLRGDFKLKDRNKRSIYLSAARSWIFNHILAQRVADGSWNQALEGDVVMLAGSNSCFQEVLSDDIIKRVRDHDLHPSGALWGRGKLASKGEIEKLETKQVSAFPILCEGLERQGLKQERRSLRLPVHDLRYGFINTKCLQLQFSLPAGCYATSVLAEIGHFS